MHFARRFRRGQSLRLWMVGDGSERKMLEDLAAELKHTIASHFLGAATRRVTPFYSAADAFIMSSKFGGIAHLTPTSFLCWVFQPS
jgi:glycosyltransferase involved in cell wall biosynthesis